MAVFLEGLGAGYNAYQQRRAQNDSDALRRQQIEEAARARDWEMQFRERQAQAEMRDRDTRNRQWQQGFDAEQAHRKAIEALQQQARAEQHAAAYVPQAMAPKLWADLGVYDDTAASKELPWAQVEAMRALQAGQRAEADQTALQQYLAGEGPASILKAGTLPDLAAAWAQVPPAYKQHLLNAYNGRLLQLQKEDAIRQARAQIPQVDAVPAPSPRPPLLPTEPIGPPDTLRGLGEYMVRGAGTTRYVPHSVTSQDWVNAANAPNIPLEGQEYAREQAGFLTGVETKRQMDALRAAQEDEKRRALLPVPGGMPFPYGPLRKGDTVTNAQLDEIIKKMNPLDVPLGEEGPIQPLSPAPAPAVTVAPSVAVPGKLPVLPGPGQIPTPPNYRGGVSFRPRMQGETLRDYNRQRAAWEKEQWKPLKQPTLSWKDNGGVTHHGTQSDFDAWHGKGGALAPTGGASGSNAPQVTITLPNGQTYQKRADKLTDQDKRALGWIPKAPATVEVSPEDIDSGVQAVRSIYVGRWTPDGKMLRAPGTIHDALGALYAGLKDKKVKDPSETNPGQGKEDAVYNAISQVRRAFPASVQGWLETYRGDKSMAVDAAFRLYASGYRQGKRGGTLDGWVKKQLPTVVAAQEAAAKKAQGN